jgi:mediator of RNA polymerase II transcription subunit 16
MRRLRLLTIQVCLFPLLLSAFTKYPTEVINALAGSVRWILDLMAWVTDTLLTLHTHVPPGIDLTDPSNLSLPDLLTHLRSTNTISLLLLSSPTRGFLTAFCRRLAHLDYIARKAIAQQSPSTSGAWLNNTPDAQNGGPQTPNQTSTPQRPQPGTSLSPALRSAYLQIATLTNNTILRIKTFETLLSSLTSYIKTAYATHNPPLSGSQTAEKARNTLEIKMLFGGSIPDAFKPVIVELFRKGGLLDFVREEIEPAKLFFADFTALEVDEDAVSVGKRRRSHMTMDSFRKEWLVNPKKAENGLNGVNGVTGARDSGGVIGVATAGGRQNARWRRCARCAAVMEDVLSQRQALQWLIMQQRRCFCSGYWNTLESGRTVA